MPGDGVSVDQIISAQPGLIPQMAGFLTSKQIWGCTTFIDLISDYIFVHQMKDLLLTETLLAKMTFKYYAPEPTGQLNIIMLITVDSQTQHS
jgi:hypothetical protein